MPHRIHMISRERFSDPFTQWRDPDFVFDFADAQDTFLIHFVIRELFEEYSTGKVTIRDLTRIAEEKGLKSRKGNKLSKSNISKILTKPVYIGDFTWDGIYYKGSHNPIVSREVFDKVQRVLKDKSKPQKRTHSFAFRGLLRCHLP